MRIQLGNTGWPTQYFWSCQRWKVYVYYLHLQVFLSFIICKNFILPLKPVTDKDWLFQWSKNLRSWTGPRWGSEDPWGDGSLHGGEPETTAANAKVAIISLLQRRKRLQANFNYSFWKPVFVELKVYFFHAYLKCDVCTMYSVVLFLTFSLQYHSMQQQNLLLNMNWFLKNFWLPEICSYHLHI